MGNSYLLWWGHFLCLFCFEKGGFWDFIHVWGNWSWCPCNKQIGGGWHSIWSWSVAMVAALDCCTIGGLSWLRVNGPTSSWNLLMGLETSWIFPWARLYTLTGIGLGLMVVVFGFTTDFGVETAIVATTFGSGKDFSISLTLNCLFMVFLVLLILSAAFLAFGAFCGGVVLPSQLVLVHGWIPLLPSSSR